MNQGPTSPVTPQNSIATKPVQKSAAFGFGIGAIVSYVISVIPDLLHLYNSHGHMIPHEWQPLFAKVAGLLTVVAVLFGRWDTKRAANEGPTNPPA